MFNDACNVSTVMNKMSSLMHEMCPMMHDKHRCLFTSSMMHECLLQHEKHKICSVIFGNMSQENFVM